MSAAERSFGKRLDCKADLLYKVETDLVHMRSSAVRKCAYSEVSVVYFADTIRTQCVESEEGVLSDLLSTARAEHECIHGPSCASPPRWIP